MITHSAILAALAELRTTAEAAAEGAGSAEWRVGPEKRCQCCNSVLAGQPGFEVTATDDRLTEHIAAWDPAHSLRWLSWAERVAAEHAPIPYYIVGTGQGWACSYEWADGDGRRIDWKNCPHVRGLAGALGLEET